LNQIGKPLFTGFQDHFNVLVNAQRYGGHPKSTHVAKINEMPLTLDAEIDESAYAWYSQHLRPQRTRRFQYMTRTPPEGVEIEPREISPPCLTPEQMEYKQLKRKFRGIPGDGSYIIIDRGKVLPFETKPVLYVRPDGSIRTVSWDERIRILNQVFLGYKGSSIRLLYDEMRHHWGIKEMEAVPIKPYVEDRPTWLFEAPPRGQYYFLECIEEAVWLGTDDILRAPLTPEDLIFAHIKDIKDDAYKHLRTLPPDYDTTDLPSFNTTPLEFIETMDPNAALEDVEDDEAQVDNGED